VAYAIGVAAPVSLYVNTNGTAAQGLTDAMISQKVSELVDMRPAAIERRLKLRNPIYAETATYGHMGREPHKVIKHFRSKYEPEKTVEVELFTWEKLDLVDTFREAFDLR
jgi:S-adenosylmethionine synthase